MKIIHVLLISLCSITAKAQDSGVYKFVVENKQIVDSTTGFYMGIEYEFSYNRVRIDKETFSEDGLLGSTRNSTHLFRVRNGNWYFNINGQWKTFYLRKRKISPNIRMANIFLCLKYDGYEDVKGISCIMYKVVPINVTVSDLPTFWFSPELGIIRIATNNVTLIREDV